MLGAFSALGLAGFVATFILIMVRAPGTPVERVLTPAEVQSLTGPRGERGPVGPAGGRGAAGDPGIRVLRADCVTGTCTVECADDEVLLNAYCSPNHAPAAFPTEQSALCRPTGRGRTEVVAACLKAPYR